MGRNVASINDVLDARAALAEKGLACALHLHDACGAQTLSLELEDGAPDDTLAQARDLIERFFADRGLPIVFHESSPTTFHVA